LISNLNGVGIQVKDLQDQAEYVKEIAHIVRLLSPFTEIAGSAGL